MDMSAAEGIAWKVWGLLSFIALIAWCRWRGPPEDQKELSFPGCRSEESANWTLLINPWAPPCPQLAVRVHCERWRGLIVPRMYRR